MKTLERALFKTVLKRKIGELFATGGSADVLITRKKCTRGVGGVGEEGLASQLNGYSLSDYFVLGVSELQVNAEPHNKIEDLIQKMKAVMGSLDRDTEAKAC